MNDALFGRTAVITGASRGLGRAIARALWRQGASLLLVARSEQPLADLKSELEPTAQAIQHVHILATDLAGPDAVPGIFQVARGVWAGVDVLINNAAILGPMGPLWENDWDAWQSTLRVNLFAPVELCRAFVPSMIERGGGKIINLSGGGATAPRARFSAYATAKAALVRFSEVLAEEVKGWNIQVNCIAPGAMNTEMNRAVLEAGVQSVGAVEYQRAVQLSKSDNASFSRAADLAVFLASPASDGITGKLISATWDPWPKLEDRAEELNNSDIYTLRRILPQDRGKNWE